MAHPTDIPSFQTHLGALISSDVPEDAASAIAGAQAVVSVVPQCGMIVDALAPHVAELQMKAARVLAGAAHLILIHGWLGKATEADGVREQARARIAAIGEVE